GSRRLADEIPTGTIDLQRFHGEIKEGLKDCLKALQQELGLPASHFLCGISQIAIGADTLFTRACQELDIPQRIFLPQPRDESFSACDSEGRHDFSDTERKAAESLLSSPHIIQERVVSDSSERTTRFEDTNLEILRVSDVIVCLLRRDSEGKAGGTDDLLE